MGSDTTTASYNMAGPQGVVTNGTGDVALSSNEFRSRFAKIPDRIFPQCRLSQANISNHEERCMETMELHRGRLIDHIQLVVKDLAASQRFYIAVFDVLK